MDTVRVLRIVEYIGPRDWVEETVSSSIHGSKVINKDVLHDPCIIRATTLGDYAEILGAGNPYAIEVARAEAEADELDDEIPF